MPRSPLTYGSLFAGVGGFDLGLGAAGMRCLWQVEINRQARAVLRRHWPDVPKHEDVRDVGRANLPPVDLISGGFPCQDLSVAGRRAGLAGERSGLWHEFHRVVAELAPRWVLIENVPGMLSSSGGRDLSVVLGGLADLGYGWAFRVLDAQHFGVPQRRRRPFIVGRAGGFCPPEVLFEPSSLPGDPAASGEAGEGVAHGITARAGNASRPAGGNGNVVAYQCQGSNVGEAGHLRRGNGHLTGGVPFLAHTLRAEGFDASEDGTGRGTPLVPAFQASDYESGAYEETASARPLTTSVDRSRAAPIALAFDWQAGESGNDDSFQGKGRKWIARAGDYTGALGATRRDGVVDPTAVPRRLTPCECERLQGFPDNWTRYTADGTELADGPRYRMMGNAVAVPCAAWIGRRIVAAMHSEEAPDAA